MTTNVVRPHVVDRFFSVHSLNEEVVMLGDPDIEIVQRELNVLILKLITERDHWKRTAEALTLLLNESILTLKKETE